MADAFVDAGLLPEEFDVKPFFDHRRRRGADRAARKE